MQILPTDFETFYDKEYSLSKMTTESYIRDKRFEVIGVSVSGEWFSGTHKQTREFLMEFDWSDAMMLAHNNLFDAAILGWKFNIHPARLACTLAMARAIHAADALSFSLGSLAKHYGIGVKGTEVARALGMRRADFSPQRLREYGDYCSHDEHLCFQLFEKMAPLLPVEELRLIDVTLRMFSKPSLRLNVPLLKTHLTEVVRQKELLLAATGASKEDLMSNPKLAEVYAKLGVRAPRKKSPTTGKSTFAFAKSDKEFTDLLEHHSVAVQAVTAARLGVKSTLEETRTERLIGIGERGLLPVPLKYAAAHTLRWGGEDKINLQNLTRGSAIKKAIEAPDGYVIIDADSSQIEARLLAWLAGQDDLVEIFRQNNLEIARGVPKAEMRYDPYRIMAARIYQRDIADISDPERFVGKTTILGCGYGMSSTKFQMQIGAMGVDMRTRECEHIIRTYRETYPHIPNLWTQAGRGLVALMTQRSAKIGKHDVLNVNLLGIRMPNELYMRYGNLRAERDPQTGKEEIVYDSPRGRGAAVRTRIYGAKVAENVTQMLARIIVGHQMLLISRRYQPVLTVHDAVASLVPEKEAIEGRTFIEACMRTTPKWAVGLPLNCETKVGKTYG